MRQLGPAGRHLLLAAAFIAFQTASDCRADISILTADGPRGAKEIAKQSANGKKRRAVSSTGTIVPLAGAARRLIDSSGLKYFIDTNIAFATSSSASGAVSDASYTHAVAADTLNGGFQNVVLTNAFDGYGAICVNTQGIVEACKTDNPNQTIYNQLGPAVADTTCKGSTSGVDRQFVFPVQSIGNLRVQRKVYVPDNDTFIRWANIFTNVGASTIPVTMTTANNQGSDASTKIVATSSGASTPSVADRWVTTFQNWSGTTSPDVRLGHVLWGGSSTLAPVAVHFADGEDLPYWSYTFNLAPGATKIILTFATGQPTRAAAAAKAEELGTSPLPAKAVACLSYPEMYQSLNFQTPPQRDAEGPAIPAASTTAFVFLAAAFAASGFFLIRRSF